VEQWKYGEAGACSSVVVSFVYRGSEFVTEDGTMQDFS